MATSVLLAALSILPYEHKDKDRTEADSELEKERSVRMATILGFSVDTKRNARSVMASPVWRFCWPPSLGSLLTPSAMQGQWWHHLSEGLCWQCWPCDGVWNDHVTGLCELPRATCLYSMACLLVSSAVTEGCI